MRENALVALIRKRAEILSKFKTQMIIAVSEQDKQILEATTGMDHIGILLEEIDRLRVLLRKRG